MDEFQKRLIINWCNSSCQKQENVWSTTKKRNSLLNQDDFTEVIKGCFFYFKGKFVLF